MLSWSWVGDPMFCVLLINAFIIIYNFYSLGFCAFPVVPRLVTLVSMSQSLVSSLFSCPQSRCNVCLDRHYGILLI